MVTAQDGALVDEIVINVLKEADLSNYLQHFVFGSQIRRIDHFSIAQEKEYRAFGLSTDDLKRLKASVEKARNSGAVGGSVYIKRDSTVIISMGKDVNITKDQIKLMEMLGEGTFAVVKRGIWNRPDGRRVDVAVKILRDASPMVVEDLQVEAGHLLKLQHPHLIALYGVVQNPAMMVFELCEGGALLDRLRRDPTPLVKNLFEYCQQIVKAMVYLENRHCVHRDLAARNILLSKDEKVVKICDFGLMRNLKENEQMYIMGPQKRVPFAWCPPEALRHRKFSHASDVWAFGVTVWEVFSLGEDPWIGCRAIDVLKRLDANERLEKPRLCTHQIFDIISLCWKTNPDVRPKFSMLKNLLSQVQFNTAQVRDANPNPGEDGLALSVGDYVTVLDNTGVTWFGQNERTRKTGTFLRSSVFVGGSAAFSNSSSTAPPRSAPPRPAPAVVAPIPPPTPMIVDSGGNPKISLPVQGSFIHTGHADVRGGNSWGRPETIDDIYLKNPIVGKPISHSPGIQLTPSITPHRSAPPPPAAPSSISWRPAGDPLHPDWGEFDKDHSPMFSPRDPELPTIAPQPKFTNVDRPARPSPPLVPSHTPVSNLKPVHPLPSTTNRNPSPQQIVFPAGVGVGKVSFPSSFSNGSAAAPPRPQPARDYQRNSPPTTAPSTSKIDVGNMPIIRPLDYRSSFKSNTTTSNTMTSYPSTSMTAKPPQPVGFDPKVVNELHNKLQTSNSFRGQTPSNVGKVQPTIVMNSTGVALGDPFYVPNALRNVAESPGYKDILKKTDAMNVKSALESTRPKSTIGLPTPASVPRMSDVLQPTPIAVPRPTPSTTIAPPPIVSRQQPTVAPQIPSSTLPRPIGALPNGARPVSSIAPLAPASIVQPVQARPQLQKQSSLTKEPTATFVHAKPLSVNIPPPSTASTSSVLSSATATGVALRAERATPTPSTATSQEDRRSLIESQISSLLPEPSPLFYGHASTSTTTATTTSQMPKLTNTSVENGVKSLPKASSTSALPTAAINGTATTTPAPPVPVAPYTNGFKPPAPNPITVVKKDPIALSMSSVLQPQKLYPEPPPAEPPRRNVDISAILNAYNTPMFTHFANPGNQMAQVPIFALSNYGAGLGYHQPLVRSGLPAITNPAPFVSGPAFTIGDDEDIIAALDPIRPQSSRTTPPSTATTTAPSSSSITSLNGISMADQMETLYKDASFVDRSRCDEMVKRCAGNVENALRELKMDHLVDSGIAGDKGLAFSALETNGWDLNRAAESLLG